MTNDGREYRLPEPYQGQGQTRDRFSQTAPARRPISDDAKAMMRYDANKKTMLVSYLFWFFLGNFGAHRFYNGRNGTAVAQLMLTIFGLLLLLVAVGIILLVAVWIWVLVDAFLIPGWVRSYNDALAEKLGG